ncbi:MAG TPA: HAMP domain-containing sensor histidine kinase [Nitrososphaeraceae archaeon]
MSSTSHQDSDNTLPESTRICHGVDVIINAILQILNHTNKILICLDHSRPSLMVNIDVIKNVIVAAKRRGVELRCITEITENNLLYCKQLMTMVDELRHLKGIKGNLYLNEIECLSPAIFHENGSPASKGIYSNMKEIVEHQRCFFETLWSVSMPAVQRIEQLDEGTEHEFLEVIVNHKKVIRVFTEMIKSMEKEALILISNEVTLMGLDRVGIIDQIIKLSMEKETVIRIICPYSKKNIKVLNRINELAPSIKILNAENNSLFSMCVTDRNKILGIEVRDLDTDNLPKAVNYGLYSNRKLAVSSFRSIFDVLWKERMLNEQLKANDKVQKDFVNIAAHELRSPIQPIIGLSELLRYKRSEGQLQQDKILDIIIRNAKRLQNLSEDILDVTRIESKSLVLKKEKFNLNQLIVNAITDSKNYIAREDISNSEKIDIDIINIDPIFRGNEDIYLEADKNRINQVISNLLVNAIKFTKSGTITITTDLEENTHDKKSSNVVVISIKDSGTGIDSKVFPKLFTKFASGSQGGTGLGLFISKNIIEAHDGKMWAENNQDSKGATFRFTLPT